MSMVGFAARWAYVPGCLFFLATVLTPFQLACAAGVAISALLSHLYLWIVVRYGVPFGILVLGFLTSPTPNIPFAWNIALANGVCYASVLISALKLLYPAWILTYVVFVRLPIALCRPLLGLAPTVAEAIGRLAKRDPAKASEASLCRAGVGDFPVEYHEIDCKCDYQSDYR